MSYAERTVARLGSEVATNEVATLKEMVDKVIELETQDLARKTYKMPENHDRIEWERLRARHDGMLAVFKTIENARAAVAREEGASK